MVTIISHFYKLIQLLFLIIFKLLDIIEEKRKYPPLPDDSKSLKYQKFKLDKSPIIIKPQTTDHILLLEYYKLRYNFTVRPIARRGSNLPPEVHIKCPRCNAPHIYIYKNNGNKGQYECKICDKHFNTIALKELSLKCPYCGYSLDKKKSRKYFNIHKCVNPKCSYYEDQLAKIPKDTPKEKYHKYKLHYIYREFVIDFFKMDLHPISEKATGFNFKKFNPHILGLVLTYSVNLKLSTRKTSQALKDIHGISISHQQISNYLHTVGAVLKPFVDTFDYQPTNVLTADETYIKTKGKRTYLWFVMDSVKKTILGYQTSFDRSVGPCILTMRMAFDKYKIFPDNLAFIADGYPAYKLAQQQFEINENKNFELIQVIGLCNKDKISETWRYAKQIVERLNRTFKSSYRNTNGYGSEDGAIFSITLWVAYYNFLRPHSQNNNGVLNEVQSFSVDDNMPAKWQKLILLSQEKILNLQETKIA
ncbi:MAG: IS66 family transposase [Cetobacterium sp.]